jgi:putative peptidoglycan lipid II flippase
MNILLALALARPLRGAGIALALSLSSAVNTVLLFTFLRKNPNIALGKTLRSGLRYTLKMILFSAAAILPLLWLNPRLSALCAGRGRLISQGLPLLIGACIYGALGTGLLVISKDKHIRGIVRMFRRK